MGRGPHGVPSRRRQAPRPAPPRSRRPQLGPTQQSEAPPNPPARGPASPRPVPTPTLIPFSGTLTAPRRIPPISACPSRPSARPANRFPPPPRPSPPASSGQSPCAPPLEAQETWSHASCYPDYVPPSTPSPRCVSCARVFAAGLSV